MPDDFLLKLHLETVVPMLIYDIIQMGGITKKHLRLAQECGQIIAEQGDVILYQSKKKGESARAINALCHGLAILAFSPGGVTFLGLHFEEQSGRDLEVLFAQFKREDFEKLKEAMEAEEKRKEEEQE